MKLLAFCWLSFALFCHRYGCFTLSVSSCSSTVLWKGYFSSLELLFHFCHKSISHICVCLFLDYLFCFIYFCVSIPLPILHSFDDCNYMSWNQVGWFPSLYYFFQNCLGILVPMSFHWTFKIILSISTKKLSEILIRIPLNLYIDLGRINTFIIFVESFSPQIPMPLHLFRLYWLPLSALCSFLHISTVHVLLGLHLRIFCV